MVTELEKFYQFQDPQNLWNLATQCTGLYVK